MLQYELRIYRQWKCSACGRTVRTRGTVASRLCECAEPAVFMELIDTPPVEAFDTSAFVTYDNETDATPTERELVEELPEHMMPPPVDTENIKPTFRRGTGYLRAETAPEVEPELESPLPEPVVEDSFGAGLEPATEEPNVTETTDGEGSGRKRRRRRRRKPREAGNAAAETETNAASNTTAGDDPQPVAQHQAAQQTEASGLSQSSEQSGTASTHTEGSEADGSVAESSEGAPKKKRRRRRRKGK